MSNRQRGEVSIRMLGVEYRLRPTFDALAQIEDEIGCGIYRLAVRFRDGDFRIRDVVSITRHCAVDPPENFETTIRKSIEQDGIAANTSPILDLIVAALEGVGPTDPTRGQP